MAKICAIATKNDTNVRRFTSPRSRQAKAKNDFALCFEPAVRQPEPCRSAKYYISLVDTHFAASSIATLKPQALCILVVASHEDSSLDDAELEHTKRDVGTSVVECNLFSMTQRACRANVPGTDESSP